MDQGNERHHLGQSRGGRPFRTVDDLRAGRAVYHDITHDSARARGHDIRLRTAEEAGAILARASGEFDFVFFEFFQTDKAGHARTMHRRPMSWSSSIDSWPRRSPAWISIAPP